MTRVRTVQPRLGAKRLFLQTPDVLPWPWRVALEWPCANTGSGRTSAPACVSRAAIYSVYRTLLQHGCVLVHTASCVSACRCIQEYIHCIQLYRSLSLSICMYMCMHMCVYLYIYIYIYTYIYVYIHIIYIHI